MNESLKMSTHGAAFAFGILSWIIIGLIATAFIAVF